MGYLFLILGVLLIAGSFRTTTTRSVPNIAQKALSGHSFLVGLFNLANYNFLSSFDENSEDFQDVGDEQQHHYV